MSRNIVETILGFVVLVAAILFLSYSYSIRTTDLDDTYKIKAKFQSAEGIIKGSDVSLAGIKIGKVNDMQLDPITFEAYLTMNIDKKVLLPIDSRAAIISSGFLGGKFISVIPGIEDENIEPGGTLKFTQSSLNLESLIGKFLYSSNEK